MGLFTGDGRVGRLNYFLVNLVIGLAWLFSVFALRAEDPTTGAPTFNPMLLVVFAVVMWASVGNSIRRLHDRGHNGWMWLVSLIPLVGIAFALYLLFAPGDELPNRYGPPPGKVDQQDLEAKRQALEELKARAAAAQQQKQESYLREDGSYDMDWMKNSVPGLDATPAASDPGLGSSGGHRQ